MDVPTPPKDQTPPPQGQLMTLSAWGPIALLPILFLLAFHIGAGYLSYQKYGSGLWAVVDFLFAYFYYPYYAFFLAKEPAPVTAMVGGKSGIMKMVKKLLK